MNTPHEFESSTTTGPGDGLFLEDKQPKAKEGRRARTIEKATAKIPSDVFLWGAGGAMLLALGFQLLGKKKRGMFRARSVESRAPLATFVGQWVPTLLLFGIYNKIVKVAGSDRTGR